MYFLLDKFSFGMTNNYINQQYNEEKHTVTSATQTPLFLKKQMSL